MFFQSSEIISIDYLLSQSKVTGKYIFKPVYSYMFNFVLKKIRQNVLSIVSLSKGIN